MTAADLIAQAAMLAFILLAVANRRLIPDFTDGNVERLEREAHRAEEARWWLQELEASR